MRRAVRSVMHNYTRQEEPSGRVTTRVQCPSCDTWVDLLVWNAFQETRTCQGCKETDE